MSSFEVIRTLRKKKQLTQAKLAALLGIDRSYLSRIESGDAVPSLKLLMKIAAELGYDLSALMPSEIMSHDAIYIDEMESLAPSAPYLESTIPLIDEIPEDMDWEGWASSARVQQKLARMDVSGNFTVAIRVKDRSMEPDLYKQDILFINPEERFTRTDGGIGMVMIAGRVHIRRVNLIQHHGEEFYLLEPSNPKFPRKLAPVASTVIFKIVMRWSREESKF